MSQRELFRVEGLPVLQNRVFNTREEALQSPTGDIVLAQDSVTGLISNIAFESEKIVYDENYQNEQACSVFFQRHLDNVASIIDKYLHSKSLIEVGCGKGFFLEHLQSKGYSIQGVDPAYEGTNEHIIKAHFTKELQCFSDGIILRHVLEHIPDPIHFLNHIAEANNHQGLIYIEVPCFDWICSNRSWFDIFYEHVNYFRLHDFEHIFGSVLESGRIFGGQYLYVVADLSTIKTKVSRTKEDFDFPEDFLASLQTAAECSTQFTSNNVWGSSSKGVIFSIYMKRAGKDLNFAIDINPAKQGKYLATSGLLVLSPEEALKKIKAKENIFIMNPNYWDEIVALSNEQFSYHRVDGEK